jgi:hypothetical protein
MILERWRSRCSSLWKDDGQGSPTLTVNAGPKSDQPDSRSLQLITDQLEEPITHCSVLIWCGARACILAP